PRNTRWDGIDQLFGISAGSNIERVTGCQNTGAVVDRTERLRQGAWVAVGASQRDVVERECQPGLQGFKGEAASLLGTDGFATHGSLLRKLAKLADSKGPGQTKARNLSALGE